MMMSPPDRQLAESDFWAWFAGESSLIAQLFSADDQRRLDALLTPQVKKLEPGLAWEIGPGSKKTYRFVLSPQGSREHLVRSKQIVAAAPELPEWEFAPAKPPKQWDMRLIMSNRRGQEVEIDANLWKYLLTAYDNRAFFDVTLVAEKLPRLDEKARAFAGYLILEGILGEAFVIERIGDVQLVTKVAAADLERLSELKDLPHHLEHLLRRK
jgi:hypothetical protein